MTQLDLLALLDHQAEEGDWLPGDAVDLFAGPGGWDCLAEDALGLSITGYEWDKAAIATRTARGLTTVAGDVRDHAPVESAGQIASPPCQGFSLLGHGAGRRDSEHLLAELEHVFTVDDLDRATDRLEPTMTDTRSLLALVPLRWALLTRPAWIAWEQVVGVQPLWDACGLILRAHGYSVATSIQTSERWGIAQTRRRAILLARAGGLGHPSFPEPTHSQYHVRTPERRDQGVAPWVSLGECLDVDVDDMRVNNQSGTAYDLAAQLATPATAVAGRTLIGFRGPNANRFNGSTKSRNDGWVVTPEQAAKVQTFPDDYPWQGTQTDRMRQIGDAVPPAWSVPLLSAVTGRPAVLSPAGGKI